MIRSANVIAKNGNYAKVALIRHSACGGCGACSHSWEEKVVEVEALDEIGTEIGDIVEIDMSDDDVLKAAAIVYVIPLVLLIVGILGSMKIFGILGLSGDQDVLSALSGFLLMTVSFIFIKRYDHKIKELNKYRIRVLNILKDQPLCQIK